MLVPLIRHLVINSTANFLASIWEMNSIYNIILPFARKKKLQ
jgi:hypothetical protein